ncbi:MAG: TlpA disulfide reductase family protein [Proteobacteria bacterium]|nr:TlpA disulfide reductase family protein [Pseudomonadota bacterium]
MQKIVLIFSVAILAIALSLTLYSKRVALPEPAAMVAVPVAETGPVTVAFELADLDGNRRSFSEWDGKHRIVNFWATWCAPCRREIPLLKAFQEQHGADGFQVIGIAVEFREPVIAYAENAQFNYPILAGEQDAMAVAESSGISFVGLPFTMVVSRDGTLIGAHMGEIHQEHLDNFVDVLGQLDRGELDPAGAREALRLL